MTMTEVPSSRSRTDLVAPDTDSAPPFQALDRLSNVRERLDHAISTLIGRLQPYVDVDNPMAIRTATPEEKPAQSALERRIDDEVGSFNELAIRLEELDNRCRL